MGLKLRIPNFAPDHSLRTMGSDLNVWLFVREFALHGITGIAKIGVGIIIHTISACMVLLEFMEICHMCCWAD